tara:strand:- start:54 stop:791 length:738 start_codon:yes stop_codon:yes gene_type:complete
MVSFITKKDSILYTVFETLKNLECNTFMFKITPEEVHIQSSDIAKICILDVKLEKNYFEKYDVNKTVILELDIDFINKVCKLFNKKNNTLFRQDDNYLFIENIQNNKNDIDKRFRINTIYTKNYNIISINRLVIDNTFRLETKNFLNICNDLNVFDDDITFTVTHEKMCFSAHNECGDIQYYIDNITSDYKINLSYKLKFIVKNKLIQLFDSMNLKLDNEKPLFLNLKKDNINIDYIIAPNYICD